MKTRMTRLFITQNFLRTLSQCPYLALRVKPNEISSEETISLEVNYYIFTTINCLLNARILEENGSIPSGKRTFSNMSPLLFRNFFTKNKKFIEQFNLDIDLRRVCDNMDTRLHDLTNHFTSLGQGVNVSGHLTDENGYALSKTDGHAVIDSIFLDDLDRVYINVREYINERFTDDSYKTCVAASMKPEAALPLFLFESKFGIKAEGLIYDLISVHPDEKRFFMRNIVTATEFRRKCWTRQLAAAVRLTRILSSESDRFYGGKELFLCADSSHCVNCPYFTKCEFMPKISD